jgi:hypothetical protein
VLTYQCGLVLAAHEAALQALVSTGDIVGWREFVIQAFQSRSCETGYVSIQGYPRGADSGFGRERGQRQPRLAGEGGGDGIKGCDAMGGGGVEVAADAAPPGEGALVVPVSGDGLVPLGGLGAALGDVVGPFDGGLAGDSQTWPA